tara:strand:- start:2001 stop:2855 length:855 start_codon:yes stop_codon:yes gene_type:complete
MVNILDKVIKGLDVIDKTAARLRGINYQGTSGISDTRAKWSGSGNEKDWRVRLSIPPNAMELRNVIFAAGGTEQLLGPLKESNGMFWPLTPSIVIQHSANYNALAQTHSNYPFQAYQNSQVDQINIIGEFPVQNQDDAKHWVATVHFLRTITKMFFGKDQELKGNPPPILFLNGYGDHVFKNIPVVVNTFNVELRSGIDYISTKQPNYKGLRKVTGSTYDEAGLDLPSQIANDDQSDTTWAPTLSNISVLVTPVYSRNSISQFSLSEFAKNGQLNIDGEKIGFI